MTTPPSDNTNTLEPIVAYLLTDLRDGVSPCPERHTGGFPMSGIAVPRITGEVAEAMSAKVREAIALGWANGYDGAAISDLIRTADNLSSWEDPRAPEAAAAASGERSRSWPESYTSREAKRSRR